MPGNELLCQKSPFLLMILLLQCVHCELSSMTLGDITSIIIALRDIAEHIAGVSSCSSLEVMVGDTSIFPHSTFRTYRHCFWSSSNISCWRWFLTYRLLRGPRTYWFRILLIEMILWCLLMLSKIVLLLSKTLIETSLYPFLTFFNPTRT